jgi:hypothetical protein
MSVVVPRPPVVFSPGDGLLRAEHFQTAYTTNDIERALALFRDRYRIPAFHTIESELPAGGSLRVDLAWVGGMMIELQRASGPGSELFNGVLPPGGDFAVRMHHLGYLIHDADEYAGVEAEAARAGWRVPFRNKVEGFLSWCFVEAPELGHYLEYIFPEPDGAAFLAGLPSS